MSSYNVLNKQM